MGDSLLKTVAVNGVVYMEVSTPGSECSGCVAYDNPDLCEALTDRVDAPCLVDPSVVYARMPSRWLAATEPRCVGARSFAPGADVCPQRHDCERFLDLARPVPTNPTYLEMWLCQPPRGSFFLPVSTTTPEGEAPV